MLRAVMRCFSVTKDLNGVELVALLPGTALAADATSQAGTAEHFKLRITMPAHQGKFVPGQSYEFHIQPVT